MTTTRLDFEGLLQSEIDEIFGESPLFQITRKDWSDEEVNSSQDVRDDNYIESRSTNFGIDNVPDSPIPHIVSDDGSEINFVTDINDNDVIFGRGGRSNYHHGNIEMRGMVQEKQHYYKSCTKRPEKAKIRESIVNRIHCKGGRFLVEAKKGIWKVASKTSVSKKVSQALREHKIRKK
eukprot:CAMPEP_0195519320 /NCGR_PEP_ID=MMETSP0794_2-20130614/14576_1 /TAXON_ID=515487 /ORGANISM="Stephanopyxis turris, Strain CCMP 815" /LENGTH=177 /DNA_ID=CAMNT_0040648445 /DNA_START=44 /DNA_END=577 /DNA_ORIENTATION=-